MTDGLKARHRAAIIATLAANDRVERAVLFGSRAMGTNTITSDVDIALFGQQLTLRDQASLAAACEELPMAQSVDLVLYSTIDNPALVEHICSDGVEWYRRGGGDVAQADDEASHGFAQAVAGWKATSWGQIANLEYGKGLRDYKNNTGKFTVYGTNGAVGTCDEYLCNRPGVIIGRKGAYRGVHYSNKPFYVIDTAYWLNHSEDVDTKYAYYELLNQDINSLDSGSAIPSTSKESFYSLSVFLPPLEEQKAIAHVLGTLDDKIALNRRMNETLEAMARALFKDWFVDFGPVRAKAEGREAYLPEEIWGLFPDSFEDSELGEIPRGWGVKRLGEVVTQRRSGVKPGQIDPNTPYIALEHMPKHCIALSEWGNANELASSKFRFQQGDILFGKLRPYFHKVGVAPLDGVCSTDIVVLSPKSDDWFGFALGYLSSSDFIDYTDATSTGTRMPRTNWQNMASYKVPLPDYEIARSYTELVRPLANKIVSNIHRSHTLSAQRDALLSRLMSGKLRVSKIDIYPERIY